ncbi:LPS export ABC transporter permease LptF [Fulvimonas soli]|jgi:lipopolysaccharide export system permease protein|uniref:Lipopolysaccharide export system permease protein LptF n=1 Tax=Fulvimonas soli TaxID=155197 RepID=A0A316I6C1_9GAMM|nr:LPS export ABC transporter permease LptF [Fulvimonas soli]PWK88524.1 lipopolysaccharide export system permease protein [Fulvimonas soli]TNY27472.1 LPS export ABC transporter permease LptF [Fulvimonas soli]
MLSILDRYFLRELAQTVVATVVVLVAIFAGTSFATVLKQVANGSFPASVMFQVLGLNMLDGLSTLLLLAGFIGLLLGLGRMWRESEMHVLASSGMGPRGLLKPIALLALALALLVGLLSLWLGPWAARTSDALVAAANRSVIAAGLDAGRFTELPGKGGIIFVDSLSRDGSVLGKTFVAAERSAKDGTRNLKLVTARRGQLYQESNGDNRFIALYDGWQYEIPLGGDNWRKMRYERNDTSLSSIQNDDSDEDPAHNLDMAALLRADSADARAELAWRAIAPAMMLVLVMLALPMARQSPREPRFGRLLLAVLSFYLYYLLLAVCRGQLMKGHWHHATPMWGVSLLVFAIAAWMFRSQYAARRPRKAGA